MSSSCPPVFLRSVLIQDDSGTPGSENGYRSVDVTLAGGKIAAIEEAGSGVCPDGAEVIDAGVDGMMLLPGSVNAHAHSSEHWARGLIKPLPLELWIHELVRHEPRGALGGKLLGFENPIVDCPASLVGLSCTHCGVETLLGGGSAILDHIWCRDLADVEAAVTAYRQLGIRTFLALMLGDTADPDPFANYVANCPNAAHRNAASGGCGCGGLGPGGAFRLMPAPADPAKTEAMAALWEAAVLKFHNPEEGINIVIGPQTCYSASPELIRRGAELRAKYNLCGHIHLLETRGQALQSRQYFGPSGTALGMLKETGFLSQPGTTLAHAVWLDDGDIKMVAEAGATVVHNPASNLRLGSGVAPVVKYLEAGVNVALGCDGACSSDGQDMLEVMKLTCLIHTLQTPEYRRWPEPKAVLKWATEGGYAGVNMAGKAGVIKVGAEADVCLFDLTSLSLLPRTDPVSLLLLGRPGGGGVCGAALAHMWVRGRRVIRDGAPATCDIKELRAKLCAAYPRVRNRELTDPSADPYTAAAEREYRASAGLDGSVRVPGASAEEAAAESKLLDNFPDMRTLDPERTSIK